MRGPAALDTTGERLGAEVHYPGSRTEAAHTPDEGQGRGSSVACSRDARLTLPGRAGR